MNEDQLLDEKVMSKTGVDLIAEERARQISEEEWTPEHDDGHVDGELAMAACCYAMPKRLYRKCDSGSGVMFIDPWPFPPIAQPRGYFDWDKRKRLAGGNVSLWPEELSHTQRLDLLVKSGALIAAEIDRVKRIPRIK